MSEPMDKLYGFTIVGFDRVSGFERDVTVISVEVPNEWLERIMTRDQLDETHRRYARTEVQPTMYGIRGHRILTADEDAARREAMEDLPPLAPDQIARLNEAAHKLPYVGP